jgi:small subunit ribosomal protein S16
MVRIRLRRVGLKKQPSYRIVVADRESPRDGRYIEIIGHYNPRTEPATMDVDEARALHWLSVGAQPSEPVARILKKLGTLDRLERMRKGEAVETLVEEANAARAAMPPINPKTRRMAPVSKQA